jgi:hypothetical protein
MKWQEPHNNSNPWQAAPHSANMSPSNATVAPLFATKLRRKTMMTAIKVGLVAFVLFAAAYVVETRAFLALEASGPQVDEYAP